MKRLAAFIVMLALAPSVPATHSFSVPAQETFITPLWVGPAFSGSWYSTDRSGEGFILQVLDNGSAVLLWFTYPPAGSPAQQAWIYADGGSIENERIRFTSAITTRGGRFGVASGTIPAVQRIPWGTVEFRFTGCNAGEVTFAGPAGWGSGTRQIVRLTEHAELGCGPKQRVGASGARLMTGLTQRTGAWYNPASDADGWAFEELPDGRAIIYWFTHDAAGEQAWTYGEATSAGERVVVTNYRPMGTRFGSGFNASHVLLTTWGTLDLTFNACDRASLAYSSLDASFGTGTLGPARLTTLAGGVCLGQKPTVPANGTWTTGATMPSMQSEMAAASIGTRTCVAGGFPAQRPFQCYDSATNTWSALAPLPAGRDHGEAVAYEGAYYFTGGYGEDGDSSGWRYDFGTGAWQAVRELPYIAASGAAMLNGFAYFGGNQSIFQYNPRTRESRQIVGDGRAQRDHSHLVAFQGELWLIAGRNGNGFVNGAVSIYDPASETWRAGPSLGTARSGFAAAATSTVLFVAGGERLAAPVVTINSAEAISAGDSQWTAIPPLPVAVHGVGSAVHGSAFYVIGGSRVAATAINSGDVQVYRPVP